MYNGVEGVQKKTSVKTRCRCPGSGVIFKSRVVRSIGVQKQSLSHRKCASGKMEVWFTPRTCQQPRRSSMRIWTNRISWAPCFPYIRLLFSISTEAAPVEVAFCRRLRDLDHSSYKQPQLRHPSFHHIFKAHLIPSRTTTMTIYWLFRASPPDLLSLNHANYDPPKITTTRKQSHVVIIETSIIIETKEPKIFITFLSMVDTDGSLFAALFSYSSGSLDSSNLMVFFMSKSWKLSETRPPLSLPGYQPSFHSSASLSVNIFSSTSCPSFLITRNFQHCNRISVISNLQRFHPFISVEKFEKVSPIFGRSIHRKTVAKIME